MILTDYTEAYAADFLRLNTEFVHWLSPLDADGLADIVALSDYARVALDTETGAYLGGLIAYRHDVDYPDHWNIAWLRQHLNHFVYIDRVVIDGFAQGRGVGQALYADLANFALQQGLHTLACEVNTVPDNPGSHRFHQRAGFYALGEQVFADAAKAVRYYAKDLAP